MGSGTTTTWSNLNRQQQQKEKEKLNQMNSELFVKIYIFFHYSSSLLIHVFFSAEEISNFPLNHVAGNP